MNSEEEEDRLNHIKHLLDSEAETRPEPAVTPTKDEETPKTEGTTKASSARRTPPPPSTPPIALDKDNMPLPKRVHEVDLEGTRVSPVAYDSSSRPRNNVQVVTSTPSQPRRTPPPS